MYTKNDMIDLLMYNHPDVDKGDAEQVFNQWQDKNPRLVTKKQTVCYPYESKDETLPFINQPIHVDAGTELRLMQCDMPESEFVIVDIITGSPSQLYYWVPQSDCERIG